MSVTLVESIPAEVPDWCDLFNLPAFYLLHKTPNSFYFSFFYNEKLIGLIHFTEVEKGIYRSPYRGTYGAINFKEELDLQIKHDCVRQLVNYFEKISAKKIEILSAPFAHDLHESSTLFNSLLNHSFEISNHEINYTLEVDQQGMIEKMMRNNKKRLNKCLREGFEFKQVLEKEEFLEVYQTIKINREGKGYNMSMSFEQILEMHHEFANSIYFFRAEQNGETAASSICVRLNNRVLYVFYWGDKPGFEQYSPVVFLANGIYEFAVERGFELMDAGTSSLKGYPNFGVATFKQNLGFITSPKLTYTKTL